MAVLTISDDPTFTYTSISAGASLDKTFTITNSGFSTATAILGAAFSTATFTFKGGTFPGAGGTCIATLVRFASCTVVVTANSNTLATYNDTVTINYTTQSQARTATRPISIVITANTPPTISTISNRSIYDGSYPYIPFTITDIESVLTCSGSNLGATSSNTTVVPLANITYTGLAPFCYVNIVPAAGVIGSSTITITVNDLGAPNLTASTTFIVTSVGVTSVVILPSNSIVPRNSTFQYIALATFSDATTQDISPSATWSVTGGAGYTVTSFTGGLLNLGTVTGGTFPAVTINANYGVFAPTASATFNSSTITGLFVTPTAASINIGGTTNLKCYGTTADFGTIDLTAVCNWTIPSSAVINVNNYYPKGIVTGVANGGPITVTATYSSFSATSAITVSAAAPSVTEVGIGLFARYFSGMGFQTFFRSRVDSNIQFAWGSGSNPAGGADAFSVRWTGQILAPETGTYTFHSNSDDGFRLWVNGILLHDFWNDHGPGVVSGNITLTAGVKYDIVAEFYENGGGSEAHLRWKVPSSACASYAACVYVPRAQLFPGSGSGMPISLAGVADPNSANYNFLNDGIVRYYSANGSGSIANAGNVTAQIESSGGAGTLTATNTNGTGLGYNSTGLVSNSWIFDGVDDVLTSANTGLITGTGVRSFSIWIKPNDVSANQGVFFYGANTNLNGLGLIITSDRRARVHGGNTDTCDSPASSITWGTWNHIAVHYVGGGNTNATVYVNGVTTSCGNKAWNTSAGNLTIGSNPSVVQKFSGEIDELAFFNVNFAANTNNFLPTQILQRQQPTPAYLP